MPIHEMDPHRLRKAIKLLDGFIKEREISTDLSKHVMDRIATVVEDNTRLLTNNLAKATVAQAGLMTLVAICARHLQAAAAEEGGMPPLPFDVAIYFVMKKLTMGVDDLTKSFEKDPKTADIAKGKFR